MRREKYSYAGSNNPDEVAWYAGNSGSKTHPVGQKKSNELGLYDMSGNVYEWCQDWYDEAYYQKSPSQNPAGADKGNLRVLRGGNCYEGLHFCRVSKRGGLDPGTSSFMVGFRLAAGSLNSLIQKQIQIKSKYSNRTELDF